MLSTAADLVSLATTAPWLGVGVLFLVVAFWLWRQQRRSAVAQGQRLGRLEQQLELERTRRQQVEAVLLDDGLRLPYWPPDGTNQPRPRSSAPARDVGDDLADDYPAGDYTTDLPLRVPVPPLPPGGHRR